MLTLQSLEHEANQYVFNRKNIEQKKEEIVEMKIGSFFLKNREKVNLSSKVDVGNLKIMSF